MDQIESALTQQLIDAFRGLRKIRWQQHLALGNNLNPSEFFVLHKIAHHTLKANDERLAAISPSDISHDLRVSSPTVTQHITSLETKGLIIREMDKHDRRKIRITLTAEGEACLKDAKQAVMETFDGLVAHLGVDQSQQLIVLLNKSTDYFSGRDLLETDRFCKEFQSRDQN